jgi:S-methylmethionine-dependent homocysteine/selenocysteine methylase
MENDNENESECERTNKINNIIEEIDQIETNNKIIFVNNSSSGESNDSSSEIQHKMRPKIESSNTVQDVINSLNNNNNNNTHPNISNFY